jgi:HSP20 family protein
MTRSTKIAKKRQKQLGHLDDIFENFRREIEGALRPWQGGSHFPSLFGGEDQLPLCDMVDRGDSYELQVEVPGIQKERIKVKATANSVEIAARQSEKSEERRKNYLYTERSRRSFYRKIPVPEQIVPAKIDAKVNNGILLVNLPKKNPPRSEVAKKVEVK